MTRPLFLLAALALLLAVPFPAAAGAKEEAKAQDAARGDDDSLAAAAPTSFRMSPTASPDVPA